MCAWLAGVSADVCCVTGVRTGRCVHSTWKPEVKVCEVYAWCPVEVLDLTDIPPL